MTAAPGRRLARTAWLVYAAGAVALATIAATGLAYAWSVERELWWVRGSGWSALVTLLAAISASPIGRALSRLGRRPRTREISVLRRALGITAAALASVHAGVALATYLRGDLAHLLDITWLRGGVLALAILGALWLTSYPRAVRALRVKLWKPLHQLAYVAVGLAFQHVMLSPMAPRRWVLAALCVTLALAALRWIPRRSAPKGDATEG